VLTGTEAEPGESRRVLVTSWNRGHVILLALLVLNQCA